ncbi:MAG TPA: DegT/DnrJ/EryC1/StrS family aminotransferase [Candidatus Baltobacteraceae bacterium]|nr:DegT/DnrJ/EryC1/StrS family aminotransferase [Candidatus Baltobacteraceae bacterium]
MKVPFSYLDRQFSDVDAYLADIRELVLSGDFTLGAAVTEFERRFSELCGMPYAIGVGTGTDALMMSLEVLGIGSGDEVITAANTFVATAGAIAMTGARIVFADNDEGYTIDPERIEAAITSRTKAIMPVHYSGNVADMPRIKAIADKHGLMIVEDACQAIKGMRVGVPVGGWGETAGFSLHPLKNLNVWGDAGVIVTRRADLYERLRLHRNHGLSGRDEVAVWGRNCRLDSLQAVIGNRLIAQTDFITDSKIANAKRYDEALGDLAPHVRIPPRNPSVRHVYHLYMVRVERRDELLAFLLERGVGAKIHYPVPLHLQPAATNLGYKKGDFPMAEADAKSMITLPAHQHLTEAEIDHVIESVRAFYR